MKSVVINTKYEPEPLFTGDWHYGHGKIVTWDPRKRHFQTITEHNQTIRDKYEDTVNAKKGNFRVDPRVFILGDFFLRTHNKKIHEVLSSLPGRKYLILGNHSEWYTKREYRKYFENVSEHLFVKVKIPNAKPLEFFLCHYAMQTYNKSHYNAINLHGHSHGKLSTGPYLQLKENKLIPKEYKCVDVGVDCWDYKPATIQNILWALCKQNLTNYRTLKTYVTPASSSK